MPVFNPTTPELRDFLTMANSDMRTLLGGMGETKALVDSNKAAQDLTNLSTNQSIETVKALALIQEVFQLNDDSFTLTGQIYRAVVTMLTVDGTQGVGMSLTDAEGDEQLVQMVSGYDGAAQDVSVELTVSQWGSNSYPLTLICQGMRVPVL